MSLVIDSSVFIAYEGEADENHDAAKELFEKIDRGEFGSIILVDYVFDEVLTQILSRRGKNRALVAGKWILSCGANLDFVSESNFREAWRIFEKSTNLSFTDCIVIAVAREKNAAIATFDSHFSQFKDLKIVD